MISDSFTYEIALRISHRAIWEELPSLQKYRDHSYGEQGAHDHYHPSTSTTNLWRGHLHLSRGMRRPEVSVVIGWGLAGEGVGLRTSSPAQTLQAHEARGRLRGTSRNSNEKGGFATEWNSVVVLTKARAKADCCMDIAAAHPTRSSIWEYQG